MLTNSTIITSIRPQKVSGLLKLRMTFLQSLSVVLHHVFYFRNACLLEKGKVLGVCQWHLKIEWRRQGTLFGKGKIYSNLCQDNLAFQIVDWPSQVILFVQFWVDKDSLIPIWLKNAGKLVFHYIKVNSALVFILLLLLTYPYKH